MRILSTRGLVLFFLACVCCGLSAGTTANTDEGNITILASRHGKPYDQIVHAVRSDFENDSSGQLRLRVLYLDKMDNPAQTVREKLSNTDLLITAGTRATEEVARLDPGIPTLATLIPNISFRLLKQMREKIGLITKPAYCSAVFLDQPLARQLELIRTALPDVKRLGVIIAQASEPALTQLKQAAADKGLLLVVRKISDSRSLAKTLIGMLDDIDALFAVPDPMVHNRYTAGNILLTAYRHHIPVIGYSRAYVDAGALFAIYSTPGQIANQVISAIHQAAQNNWRLPEPAYPVEFNIKVNAQVAHSLRFNLPSAKELLTRLRHTEAKNP